MGFEGFEHASFDGDQLMELLAELDAELGAHTAGTGPYRVAIAGGAAMALRLSDRLTGDVDVVSEGMHPDVRRAAEAVASRHDLRPDWINDAAKLKTVSVDADLEPVYVGANFVVESVGARYLLAMKLASARVVDKADCVALAAELRIQSLEELLDVVEAALPNQRHRTVKMQYFAQEVIDAAQPAPRRRPSRGSRARD